MVMRGCRGTLIMLLVVVVQILHVLRVEAVLLVVVKGGWLLVEARADPRFNSNNQLHNDYKVGGQSSGLFTRQNSHQQTQSVNF